jgi:hypothetical protein
MPSYDRFPSDAMRLDLRGASDVFGEGGVRGGDIWVDSLTLDDNPNTFIIVAQDNRECVKRIGHLLEDTFRLSAKGRGKYWTRIRTSRHLRIALGIKKGSGILWHYEAF